MTETPPNILIVVMDTTRARTVLDNEVVMLNFHEFASEGTLFTNAFSTAPWTLPSHARSKELHHTEKEIKLIHERIAHTGDHINKTARQLEKLSNEGCGICSAMVTTDNNVC